MGASDESNNQNLEANDEHITFAMYTAYGYGLVFELSKNLHRILSADQLK